MGQRLEDGSKDRAHKRGNEGLAATVERSDDNTVIGVLKRMQQQLTYLERKVDTLTRLVEERSENTSSYSRSSRDRDVGSSYRGSSDKKFSRGRSRDDDGESGGYNKGSSFGRAASKSSGRPTGSGKPFKKTYGKPSADGAKKKSFTFKKFSKK